ncbi:MAG TPA: GNVR domain-containing protein [Bryobacteraceae bacterium]|jgi:polysaccharide chain length determinant protein (PEP-CTERM system associated)|nr:GNVR domain-containing protein [Bryobacteraceae bacterium]
MQPVEAYNVTRRALDVEDYIDIGRRHKGWIFGPFLFCVVASVVGVYLWPDSYLSAAVIKITPQQIPESMVQSSINQQMYDRINSMEQTILSRSVLTTIINTYNLYPSERARLPIEDVIDSMRKKISVIPVRTGSSDTGPTRIIPAFAVQFSYEDRHLAQRVVQDLVGRFIDENTRNSSNRTFMTTQFMKDEVDSAKKDLDVAENKLASFRMENNGRLPDQMQSNMQSMQALQSQVTVLDASISRANQEKLQLEATIRILQGQLAEMKKQPPPDLLAGGAKNDKLAQAERELQSWDDALRQLRQKYTENNPDVQTALARYGAAQQKVDQLTAEETTKKAENKADTAPKPQTPLLVRELRDADGRIQQLQSSIEAKDLEIAEYTKQMKRASDLIKTYQARIEVVPMGEKQFGDLQRDRDLARQHYVEVAQKLERAGLAQEMENRKQGEMLEILDSASLPISPTEPKRPLIISIGAGLGLLLGLVIAGGREMKDTSLKNLKDVRAYTQMAILGSIPLLENDFVVRRRRRLAWLGWTTACLAAVVVISGSVVYYYVTKQ